MQRRGGEDYSSTRKGGLPKKKLTPLSQSPNKSEGRMTGVEFKHPVVVRLMSAADRANVRVTKDQRFKQIIRSLACAVAVLWDYSMPTGGNKSQQNSQREKQKWQDSFVEAVNYLSTLGPDKDEEATYIKWYTASLYQKGVGDVREDTSPNHVELPKGDLIKDTRKSLFVGVIHRKLKQIVQRAKARSRKCISILSTFLQSKDFWPVMTDYTRVKTVRDHLLGLSATPSFISEDMRQMIVSTVQWLIRRTTVSNNGGCNLSDHASFYGKVKDGGGGRRILTQRVSNVPALQINGKRADEGGSIFDNVKSCQEEIPIFDVRWNRTSYPDRVDISSVFSRTQCGYTLKDFTTEFSNWRDELWTAIRSEAQRETMLGTESRLVRISLVSEAGKFRPITMGDELLYYNLQPLQRHLLDKWKVLPYSTMNDEWLDRVAGMRIPKGWVWNSGDYKAATDNLNGNACRIAELTILQQLDLVGLTTHLTDAIIVYQLKDLNMTKDEVIEFCATNGASLVYVDEKVAHVEQRNGQLMGHPLSFPILCILNLAALKTALRRARRYEMLTAAQARFILEKKPRLTAMISCFLVHRSFVTCGREQQRKWVLLLALENPTLRSILRLLTQGSSSNIGRVTYKELSTQISV
jgi:hypothetical protein